MAPLFYRKYERTDAVVVNFVTHLEDLHILNSLLVPTPAIDSTPSLYHILDIGDGQTGEGAIVSGVEADDIAAAFNRLGGQEGMRGGRCVWSGRWEYGSVVVGKDERGRVRFVLLATCTCIAGAEIALGVVSGEIGGLGGLGLPLPRSLCAVGRDEDVLAGKGVHWTRCCVSARSRAGGKRYVRRRWGWVAGSNSMAREPMVRLVWVDSAVEGDIAEQDAGYKSGIKHA